MRTFLIILVMVTLSNMAKAATPTETHGLRGGHPRVMSMLWNNEITKEQATKIQICIESLDNESETVATCIQENK